MTKVEWKEKKTSVGNAIIIGAVMTVIGIFVGANFKSWFGTVGNLLGFTNTKTSVVDWSPLDEVYNQLSSSYNGELNKSKIIDGAKKGLVEAVGDNYTVYMDAETSSDFYDDLHGNVGYGIGVEIGMRDGYVRVLRTLPDNPAKRAGILAGDIMFKIDDEEVWSLKSEEVARKVRGGEGTNVKVTVVRNGKELTFDLTREKINNVSAYVEYDGNTAIIVITRFDNDTGTKVQNMAKEFESKKIDKIILDLRNNGGGYVSAAQDLLSLWLDGQDILVQKSKHLGNTVSKSSSGKAIFKSFKTVVLVNGSTASASEIVAGAMQDYGIATIVGEKTYGKGVVQGLYSLSDGGTLKVTTAEWFTPKERSINGTGITPDIVVERTYDDINAMRDPQLSKAKEL